MKAEFPASNILWGAAASALVGAPLAEWKRKRDEEELAKLREREERLANGPSSYRLAGMAYQRSLDNFRETLLDGGFSAEEVKALKSEAVSNGYIPSAKEMVKERKEEEASREAARQDYREGERGGDDEKVAAWLAAEEARKAEETQAGLLAYYQGRKAGETPVTPVKEEKSWLEKTIDWVDKHQIEISIGIGCVVGVAAIIASGGAATPLVVAAWVAGAAAVAGGTVALGTVGLNAYYSRPLGENVVRNLVIAGGTAAVLTGAGFLFQGAVQGVASYCTLNSNSCSCAKVEPALNAFDTAEETWLVAKGSYQTWIGDSAGAADTAIELQMEYMDGGMPGNSVSHEVSEQLAKLGDDVPELIATYGDEGIALLLKFGDDTGGAINLVKQFGTPAVKVLDAVDFTSAKTLLGLMLVDKTCSSVILEFLLKETKHTRGRSNDKRLQRFLYLDVRGDR